VAKVKHYFEKKTIKSDYFVIYFNILAKKCKKNAFFFQKSTKNRLKSYYSAKKSFFVNI